MTEPNLFGLKPKVRRKPVPTATGQAVHDLIIVWATLFEARFGEKPILTGKDAGALKAVVTHAKGDVALVRRRLAAYLDLTDAYIAGQGYPLALLLGAWNRLVIADRPEISRVPDADRTAAYLRGLKGGRS